MALLEARGLSVDFGPEEAPLRAVDGVDLGVDPGEVLGLVGESGCGKSTTALALMGLVEPPGRVSARRLAFAGEDLSSARALRRLRGRAIGMVFQDPATSLDPCYSAGAQLMETLKAHGGGSRRERRRRALALLRQVGIPDPEGRFGAYPHQLSGGMGQRLMIALAIACGPRLLIADEPTSALDVTIQAQILRLLAELQRRQGMAMLLITHDLAVAAQTCHRVLVMYAGQVVESGPVAELFGRPRHPYTQALLNALPERSAGRTRLAVLPGAVPGLHDRPPGCPFHPRCPNATEPCGIEAPALAGAGGRRFRCHYPLDDEGRPRRG